LGCGRACAELPPKFGSFRSNFLLRCWTTARALAIAASSVIALQQATSRKPAANGSFLKKTKGSTGLQRPPAQRLRRGTHSKLRRHFLCPNTGRCAFSSAKAPATSLITGPSPGLLSTRKQPGEKAVSGQAVCHFF
jgi:hypothetical protein